MRNRRSTLLWMKDLIDHMNRCHDQLQWAPDGPTSSFLTDSLLVDLSECRRLCEQLQDDPRANKGGRTPAMTA
jgi:hypothetical protein